MMNMLSVGRSSPVEKDALHDEPVARPTTGPVAGMLNMWNGRASAAAKDSLHDEMQNLVERMDRMESKIDLLVAGLLPAAERERGGAGPKAEPKEEPKADASAYTPSPRVDKLRAEVAKARTTEKHAEGQDGKKESVASTAPVAPVPGSPCRGAGKDAQDCEIKWKNAVAVPQMYRKRGCDVPQAHRRAMTLEQFEELYELVEAVLLFHREVDRFGVTVTSSNVNLYHINDLFVKPLTFRESCSFMELVASGPQDPLVGAGADLHRRHADGSVVVRNAKRYQRLLNPGVSEWSSTGR